MKTLLAVAMLFATGATVRATPLPTVRVDLGDGVAMEFVLIRPGTFTMGSASEQGDGDEEPPHAVTITRAFYIGKFEVTQTQWKRLMGNNPSRFKGPQLPVDTVSWRDCQRFLVKLSEVVKGSFTLPTEAQWEFVCRAGATTRWTFGDTDATMNNYAWTEANSGGTTHPVGQKRPNAWGVCDLHGNVSEWCTDWYANPYPRGAATDPIGPIGPATGGSRVVRGGAWGDHPDNARSATRNCNGPDGAHDGIGFRCLLLIEDISPAP